MVTCDLEAGNECARTGLGDLTPSQIIKVGAKEEQETKAIYNYSLTHPDYNYVQDPDLEDTGKFIVSNAIFVGSADYISRKPNFWDRVSSSWKALAYGASSSMAAILAGGGTDPYGHDTPSIHGNSLSSPRKTTLYELVDAETEEHLKFGITSNPVPENRYSQLFLKDKKLIYLDEGSRLEMYELEESFIINNPRGPLQFNNH
jgi:hypothetical protein